METLPNRIDDDEKQLAALMEAQGRVQAVHEQRITQVESKLTIIEYKQTRADEALEKLADAMTMQTHQTTLNEAAIVAIKERTDDHNRQIVDLKKEQVDVGKVLEVLKSRVGTIWAIGAAVCISALGVTLAHIVPQFLR